MLTLTTMLLEVGAHSLMMMLIWFVVIGVIFWLLYWLIGVVQLPDPFAKVAKVILAVVAVIIIINFLLSILGSPF